MKIAMVSEHASPLAAIGGVDAGGQNLHVADLAAALVRHGHEVRVYTRRDDADLPAEVEMTTGVIVEHVPAGPARSIPKDQLLPFMPDFGAYLAAGWAAAPPDVVHAHFWMSGLAALAGARPSGIPVVQTFHALGSVKHRQQGAKDTSPAGRIRTEATIASTVDKVIATSSDEVFELARLGVQRRKVCVVPCGVDLEQFADAGPSKRRGRRARVLSVGRLVERKGFGNLIEALASVPDAELLVAGGPPRAELTSDTEAVRLLGLAERFGVADRVEFLGAVPRTEMPTLMRSADVVACAPWYEPFGMTALEAMACGVPVIATGVGGLADTVIDGVTGILVPPRRPDVLAEALTELLADGARRAQLGAASAARARSRYSWDRIAADSHRVYRQVCQLPVSARAGMLR
jgi:glycosyltransferase involved in cell wall biosynthesis